MRASAEAGYIGQETAMGNLLKWPLSLIPSTQTCLPGSYVARDGCLFFWDPQYVANYLYPAAQAPFKVSGAEYVN